MTPADEIRNAAARLRDFIAPMKSKSWSVARERCDGPEGDGSLQAIGVEPIDGPHDFEIIFQDDDIEETVAEYIAAMDPEVGLLLAEWLQETVESLGSSSHPARQEFMAPHALAIARRINGVGKF